LLGGSAGTCNRVWIIREGAPPESHGKVAARKLRQGDVVRLATGGGGGFGIAVERDPEAVQADVRNGLLTVEQAQELYAVVINPDTLAVERKATAAMRAAIEDSTGKHNMPM
jgi:N-methylhydantoinase B